MKHRDAAETDIDELPEVLAVIAGNIDELRSLAGLAQKLLDDVVVQLVPIPGLAQRPVVDEVADHVQLIAFGGAQEIEKFGGLSALRAKVNVGNEYRPVVPGPCK